MGNALNDAHEMAHKSKSKKRQTAKQVGEMVISCKNREIIKKMQRFASFAVAVAITYAYKNVPIVSSAMHRHPVQVIMLDAAFLYPPTGVARYSTSIKVSKSKMVSITWSPSHIHTHSLLPLSLVHV